MTRDEFHQAHGEAWFAIANNPAFFAAMQLVSASKLAQISQLTDEQIEQNGKTLIADFRGHLNVENALIELAVTSAEPLIDLPPETYADPQAPPEQSFVEPAAHTSDIIARHFPKPARPKKRKSK